jgi:hypothetical protein
MSDPSIIQVLKVFKDGLTNSWKEVEISGESKATD